VHFHFRSVRRDCIPGIPARDNRGCADLRKSENGISVSPKEYGSMNANARELAASFDLEKLTANFYADPTRPTVHCGSMSRSKLLPNGSYFRPVMTSGQRLQEHEALSSDKRREVFAEIRLLPALRTPHTSLVFNARRPTPGCGGCHGRAVAAAHSRDGARSDPLVDRLL